MHKRLPEVSKIFQWHMYILLTIIIIVTMIMNNLCCMGTRTGGSGTRTSTGYTYRVLGYFNGTSPAVPRRTQIQSHVPGTSCMKIGYLRGFWYAVPCVWVRGRYIHWTIYLSSLFEMSQFAKFEVQNFKN